MKEIYDYLKDLDTFSEQKFNIKIPKYEVLFNLNSVNIIGMFIVKKQVIKLRFHKELIEKVGFEKYKEIVIHEYGHLINYLINKGNVLPHGKEWKYIMNQFGIKNPTATTSSFFKELRTKAKCKCSIHYLSKIQVQKIESGFKLRCNICNKKIKIKNV